MPKVRWNLHHSMVPDAVRTRLSGRCCKARNPCRQSFASPGIGAARSWKEGDAPETDSQGNPSGARELLAPPRDPRRSSNRKDSGEVRFSFLSSSSAPHRKDPGRRVRHFRIDPSRTARRAFRAGIGGTRFPTGGGVPEVCSGPLEQDGDGPIGNHLCPGTFFKSPLRPRLPHCLGVSDSADPRRVRVFDCESSLRISEGRRIIPKRSDPWCRVRRTPSHPLVSRVIPSRAGDLVPWIHGIPRHTGTRSSPVCSEDPVPRGRSLRRALDKTGTIRLRKGENP